MINCICVDHDGYNEFETCLVRTARKAHVCGECRENIPTGVRYEYFTSKYDGQFFQHKTCLSCVRVRNDFCKCGWICGEMWAAIHEANCLDGDRDEDQEVDEVTT